MINISCSKVKLFFAFLDKLLTANNVITVILHCNQVLARSEGRVAHLVALVHLGAVH